MRELTVDELDQVSGGDIWDALPIWGTALAIGGSTYGSGWGSIAVMVAWGTAPLAAATMIGLAFYGGYQVLK